MGIKNHGAFRAFHGQAAEDGGRRAAGLAQQRGVEAALLQFLLQEISGGTQTGRICGDAFKTREFIEPADDDGFVRGAVVLDLRAQVRGPGGPTARKNHGTQGSQGDVAGASSSAAGASSRGHVQSSRGDGGAV